MRRRTFTHPNQSTSVVPVVLDYATALTKAFEVTNFVPPGAGEELCHCGEPIHYPNEQTYNFVEAMDRTYGPMMIVTINDRSWLIPRQYIAAHKLRTVSIETLGFEDVLEGPKRAFGAVVG